MNSYGLSAVDPAINNTIYPVVLSAPFLYEKQQASSVKSTKSLVSKSAEAPKQKPELIFNFMGFVWGTNDPSASNQKWMSDVGKEVKSAAKEAIEDAKDAAKESLTRKAITNDGVPAGGEEKTA